MLSEQTDVFPFCYTQTLKCFRQTVQKIARAGDTKFCGTLHLLSCCSTRDRLVKEGSFFMKIRQYETREAEKVTTSYCQR